MTLFSRRPHRLEDPVLIEAAVRTLHKDGFARHEIEEALIRTAPVDLDLLAQCLTRVLCTAGRTIAVGMGDGGPAHDPSCTPFSESMMEMPVRRAA